MDLVASQETCPWMLHAPVATFSTPIEYYFNGRKKKRLPLVDLKPSGQNGFTSQKCKTLTITYSQILVNLTFFITLKKGAILFAPFQDQKLLINRQIPERALDVFLKKTLLFLNVEFYFLPFCKTFLKIYNFPIIY